MDISLLQYPKKSHRKVITLPEENVFLAEFLGIVIGDGGINNPWQVVISLNALLDLEYSNYISSLIQSLFSLSPSIRKRPNQNTLVVVVTGINLVNFLIEKGAVRGNKVKQQIDIPPWILGNQGYEKAFVRGLIDTDGCIYFHKHAVLKRDRVDIGICFTSYSKKITTIVASIMLTFGLKPHVMKKDTRIYLYGEKEVIKYLSIFGSSNERITSKYDAWKDARVV